MGERLPEHEFKFSDEGQGEITSAHVDTSAETIIVKRKAGPAPKDLLSTAIPANELDHIDLKLPKAESMATRYRSAELPRPQSRDRHPGKHSPSKRDDAGLRPVRSPIRESVRPPMDTDMVSDLIPELEDEA